MRSANGDQLGGSIPQGEPDRDLIAGSGIAAPAGSAVIEARPNSLPASMSISGLRKALQRHWLLALSLGIV